MSNKENEIAHRYLREGRFTEAMQEFERHAARGRGVSSLLQAAYTAADGQLWSDAERLLRQVIELAPDSVDAHVKLGLVFESQDRLTEARCVLERALGLEERQPVLTLLGSIQRRLGDETGAVSTLCRSVALNSNDDEAHHGLGLALRETDPEQAVTHFRRALELDPAHPYTHRISHEHCAWTRPISERRNCWRKTTGSNRFESACNSSSANEN